MKNKNPIERPLKSSNEKEDKKDEKQKVPPFPPGDPYAPPAEIEDPQKIIPKTVTSQIERRQ